MKVTNTYIVRMRDRIHLIYECIDDNTDTLHYFSPRFHMNGTELPGLEEISNDKVLELIDKTQLS